MSGRDPIVEAIARIGAFDRFVPRFEPPKKVADMSPQPAYAPAVSFEDTATYQQQMPTPWQLETPEESSVRPVAHQANSVVRLKPVLSSGRVVSSGFVEVYILDSPICLPMDMVESISPPAIKEGDTVRHQGYGKVLRVLCIVGDNAWCHADDGSSPAGSIYPISGLVR